MRKAEWVVLGLVVLSFITVIFCYPLVPERMASHWNAMGEVDGYMPSMWGLLIMPILSVFIFLLFLAVPRIDPKRKNIEKFRGYFDMSIIAIFGFFLYIHMVMIYANLGFQVNFMHALIPAFAVLFFVIGIMVEKARQNWFIGIRTPWTLSSEKVWNKTHRLGGRLFKACGVICLLGLVSLEYTIWFILAPAVASAAYLFYYSYREYQKLPGKR